MKPVAGSEEGNKLLEERQKQIQRNKERLRELGLEDPWAIAQDEGFDQVVQDKEEREREVRRETLLPDEQAGCFPFPALAHPGFRAGEAEEAPGGGEKGAEAREKRCRTSAEVHAEPGEAGGLHGRSCGGRRGGDAQGARLAARDSGANACEVHRLKTPRYRPQKAPKPRGERKRAAAPKAANQEDHTDSKAVTEAKHRAIDWIRDHARGVETEKKKMLGVRTRRVTPGAQGSLNCRAGLHP